MPKQIPNKTVAVLLALFLGGIGVHRFYIGQTKSGLIWFFSALLLSWTFIAPVLFAFFALFEAIGYMMETPEKWESRFENAA